MSGAAAAVVVVKLGGEVVGDARLPRIAADLAELARGGTRLLVVHGGGPQISALSRRLGLEPRIVGGRRVTDAATLQAVKMAVAGEVNVDLSAALRAAGLRPVGLSDAIHGALGESADIVVVCVDVPGCEHGAILSCGDGGTIIFFSMATSFSTAALGAEGLAADVTMLIGNGFTPGHAELAFDLLRSESGVAQLFTERLVGDGHL